MGGFVEFRAGGFPGEEVVGFLGHGAGDLAAVLLDEGFVVVAGFGEGAGDDEGFSGEGELGGLAGMGAKFCGLGVEVEFGEAL